MTEYCLCCGKPLKEGEKDYHASCKKIFSLILDNNFSLEKLIDQQINNRKTITGVQKKMSASFERRSKKKETIYKENFIIKFPSKDYPFITEMENLCMDMAELCHIHTVPHSLFGKDGQYYYLTKRMDRIQDRRIPMEDFCQLSQRLTEDKYKGSYESFNDLLDNYSSKPIADKVEVFYRILFCFIIGNNDMHLKNFSLIANDQGEYLLSPAYDLLNVMLINPLDREETALTVHGKKKNLHRKDFLELASKYSISDRIFSNLILKLKKDMPSCISLIRSSLLSDELKEKFILMIKERLSRLEGV